jgi:hypothetical protein
MSKETRHVKGQGTEEKETEDSEYEVDEDSPLVKEESRPPLPSAPPQPPPTPATARHPPSPDRFHPDKIKTFLLSHESAIENIQAVIFVRRPIATVVILLLANAHFRLYYTVKQSAYSFAIFVLAYAIVLISPIGAAIIDALYKLLFGGKLDLGNADDPSKIRPAGTIADSTAKILGIVLAIPEQAFTELIQDNSSSGLIRQAGFYFGLALITWLLDPMTLLFWVINLFLIVPGLLVHPYSVKLREEIVKRARQAFAFIKQKINKPKPD